MTPENKVDPKISPKAEEKTKKVYQLYKSDDFFAKPFPAVKDGFCSACGYPRGAHKWECIMYFIDAGVHFMYKRIKMAHELLSELDKNGNVPTDEVKKLVKELEYSINVHEGLKES